MLKLFNRKKKDNKGFTLVELIIVIAILAILVGLLAPQYTKYVEKSRKAADVSNMDELIKAVQVYVIDDATKEKVTAATDVKLSIDSVGVKVAGEKPTSASTGTAELFYDAFEAYVPNWSSLTIKGNHWDDTTNEISVLISYDAEGAVTLKDYKPTAYDNYVKKGTN